METVISRFTVLFEDPFWIGIYERECEGLYEVSKVTFGAEPKDGEVYEFIQKNWDKLSFSPPKKAHTDADRRINPKRMHRIIDRQLKSSGGVGTKAQQALQLQRESQKQERKLISREQREAEKERRFDQKQEKRREKHRGH